MTDSADHDQDLLQRARAFDHIALAAIYDAYHPPLYRYIAQRVADPEQARDLAADLFNRLLQALQNGRGPTAHLRAWLYRAAHNLVVDHYRRQQHRRHLPLSDSLPAAGTDPAAQAADRMQAARVRAALQQLTPDQQQVIALKFLAGMSNEETAIILQKPVGAVKSLQHRALAALQRLLLPAQEKVTV
jgi:RNA polymerase sigma-70 factor (ECF subfamily)